MTYLRVEVRGDYTPYHYNRLDGQSIGMLRVCVGWIEHDGWSLRWVVLVDVSSPRSRVHASPKSRVPVSRISWLLPVCLWEFAKSLLFAYIQFLFSCNFPEFFRKNKVLSATQIIYKKYILLIILLAYFLSSKKHFL